MIPDEDLRIGKTYLAEIIDKSLTGFYGRQLKVKFTGLCFRNVEYIKKVTGDFINDPHAAARNKLYNRSLEAKPDAILWRDQLKLIKAVPEEERSI